MDTLKVHKRHGGATVGPWTWEHDDAAADVPYDDAVKLLAVPGGEFYLAGEMPARADAAVKAATSPGFVADPEPGTRPAPQDAPGDEPGDAPGDAPQDEPQDTAGTASGTPAPKRPARPRTAK
jgi:hypothetical protein